MPSFLSRLLAPQPASRSPDYYERRAAELLEGLAPGTFEAPPTLQGEMIRHAYHLFDDGYRRGFENWATSGEAALDFLRRYLPDPRVFNADRILAIHAALDSIVSAGPDAGLGLPLADLRLLLFRAVDWCDANPRPIPLPRNY